MKAPSTYEKALEWNLEQWKTCVRDRSQLLRHALQGGSPQQISHIYMENWFIAAEHVMAYEKALGLEPEPLTFAAHAPGARADWVEGMRHD